MTIRVQTMSAEKFKLINKILVAGNYTFSERDEEIAKSDLTTEDYRSMIKNRRPQMLGKTLNTLTDL